MANFLERIQPILDERVLDIGGTPLSWKLIGYQGKVTLLNISIPHDVKLATDNYEFMLGDGTNLSFPENKFL